MSIFESINNTSKKTSDLGETYIKKSKEYFRLKVFQQLAVAVSMVGKALIIGGLLFIGLIFMAIAGAIALGDFLDNIALGYIIIAAVFMMFALIVYKYRSHINNKVIDKLYPKFFNS